MKVLLIDAYDSFVFIIDQYLKSLGLRTRVLRCDMPDLYREIEIEGPNFVVLGPGPGRPEEAGYLQLIERLKGRMPLLGVCLGHQAIGLHFGASVVCANNIVHGKTSSVFNDGKGVFLHTGSKPINVTRYHSLIVDSEGLPRDLLVTARSREDGYIMGLRHCSLPIEGVQFHPESISTEDGMKCLTSFLVAHVLGHSI
jgi:anthranilate synthase component II